MLATGLLKLKAEKYTLDLMNRTFCATLMGIDDGAALLDPARQWRSPAPAPVLKSNVADITQKCTVNLLLESLTYY